MRSSQPQRTDRKLGGQWPSLEDTPSGPPLVWCGALGRRGPPPFLGPAGRRVPPLRSQGCVNLGPGRTSHRLFPYLAKDHDLCAYAQGFCEGAPTPLPLRPYPLAPSSAVHTGPLLPPTPPCSSHLLHRRQALELGAAEVLLLERGRLQHEVLLLGRVHLLQVLGRRAGLPVQRLLDHLGGRQGTGGGSAVTPPLLPQCLGSPSPLNCSGHPGPVTTPTTGHHALGRPGAGAVSPCLLLRPCLPPQSFGSWAPLLPNCIRSGSAAGVAWGKSEWDTAALSGSGQRGGSGLQTADSEEKASRDTVSPARLVHYSPSGHSLCSDWGTGALDGEGRGTEAQ